MFKEQTHFEWNRAPSAMDIAFEQLCSYSIQPILMHAHTRTPCIRVRTCLRFYVCVCAYHMYTQHSQKKTRYRNQINTCHAMITICKVKFLPTFLFHSFAHCIVLSVFFFSSSVGWLSSISQASRTALTCLCLVHFLHIYSIFRI